nr:7258_t:CDS:2 [Entrophospora candida]
MSTNNNDAIDPGHIANIDIKAASLEVKEEKEEDTEEVLQNCLLFPTYATKHDTVDGTSIITDKWHIRVRGWAFSIPKSSRMHSIFLDITSRVVGISKTDLSYECLKDRTEYFWSSNMSQGDYTVQVIDLTDSNKMTLEGDPNDLRLESQEDENRNPMEKFADKLAAAGEILSTKITPKSGHFSDILSVPEKDVEEWMVKGHLEPSSGDNLTREAGSKKIKLLKMQAFQDKIDTEILDGVKVILSNTFIRPFKDVPGMAELYRKWYDRGVGIHYVSNSPWQLFPALRSFFNTYNFPPGSAHLKFYDGLIKSAVEQKENPMASKFMYIRELLKDFPKRKFILVGDTEHPDRIIRIFVRDVTTSRVKGLPPQKPKHSYAKTFTGIYSKLRDYYMEEDDKKLENNVTPQNSDNSDNSSSKQAEEGLLSPGMTSNVAERLQGGLSNLLKTSTPDTSKSTMPKPPSEVKLPSTSATSPTKTESPSPEILKTPLEMFHERIEKLNQGLPKGLFSLFTDFKELDEDPIILNALNS